MTKAYYNEFEPYAAQWLRNLIEAGCIADGDVDERDIRDVEPSDLKGYTQCHFFAGIGGWSLALRLAGWSDDRPVWTGSAPCQPFSIAGKQKGTKDERHLFPVWFRLIKECRPDTIFGEQVEAAIKHGWFDLVQNDLEEIGYTLGGVCLPAASVGAPHIRQRLWFVGHTDSKGLARWKGVQHKVSVGGGTNGVADIVEEDKINRCDKKWSDSDRTRQQPADNCDRRWRKSESPWSKSDWVFSRDGKWRQIESGTSPMANGIPARMGQIRAYGNAIVPQVAAEVIKAYTNWLECCPA